MPSGHVRESLREKRMPNGSMSSYNVCWPRPTRKGVTASISLAHFPSKVTLLQITAFLAAVSRLFSSSVGQVRRSHKSYLSLRMERPLLFSWCPQEYSARFEGLTEVSENSPTRSGQPRMRPSIKLLEARVGIGRLTRRFLVKSIHYWRQHKLMWHVLN